MTEEGVEADLLTGGRRQSRRERFRDRLLKKADKSPGAQRDEDLNAFLKSPSEGDTLPSHPSPSRKPVPRLSVSSSPRWPDTQGVDVTVGEGTGHLGGEQYDDVPYRPSKPRRQTGLKVGFAESAPEIIGEGGDEAGAPTVWISQRRQSGSVSASASNGPSGSHGAPIITATKPTIEAKSVSADQAGEEFRPRILVRAPTGFAEARLGQDAMARSTSIKDGGSELGFGAGSTAQSKVHSDSGLLPAAVAEAQRKMREEEARAFTSGLRDRSPDPPRQQQNYTPSDSESFPPSSTALQARQGHSPNASSTYLSPEGQSPSPSRPSSSSSHGSTKESSVTQQSSRARNGSTHARPSIATSPKRKPVAQTPAPEPREDVLPEFRLYARRYYGLFVLSTENRKPGLDAPLSRWVRAAAWWFLTAESNFKLLRRDLEEGVDVLQITASRRHMQAVVDLAKTAWIVEDVVRDYAEAESIDLSTPESLNQLIQSDPHSRFSWTLQYWQDLSKRVGSLVAAARRNGFMTSTSESQPLSPGIDSTIWLTYPDADEGIANWFRLANPPWVKMDETMAPAEPSDLAKIIPLKSTGDTIRIRSIFCQASGGFQNQHRTPFLPCILTIGRRTGSYSLVLFVASQDHSINVVVETDPVRGDGIKWQPSEWNVVFNFADEFQFEFQLQQADYFHLKDCYDLALRASTGTTRDAFANANMGERLLFRTTSKTFERRSSEKLQTFPHEGEQKNCEIMLFEKYEVIKGESTSCKAHRGIRLGVMLSPFATSLGILDVHLGGDKPILVHSAHEYNPPLVEIRDSHRASLLVQFPRSREFNRFYEILTSLEYTTVEDGPYADMPLRSFSIEPTSSNAISFLKGVPWIKVQIRKGAAPSQRGNHSTNVSQSPTICIGVTSHHAVFSDKLSEGRSQVYMCLRVADPVSLYLWRGAQQDMSIAIRFRVAAANAPTIADQILAQSRADPTVWKYTFASPHEVHLFQKALTGVDVLFDGRASSFLVTRGNGLRTKKEEFGITRLQVVHDGSKQLWLVLAYFEDGQAMNFALEPNDVVERANGKGKYSVRFVEAKINFPADGDNDQKRGFVCVENVTEGDERDDITLTFEEQDSRDRLAQILPASVRKASSLMGALHLRS